jgi:hypothetical protein
MRRLAIGDHGLDVKHLQQAINARARPRGIATLHVDGLFGRKTRTAAERVGRALGAREDTIRKHPLTVGLQRIIRHPATRTPLQLRRARERQLEHPVHGGAGKGSFGIDWAWGTPKPAALKAAGVKFACRYLSHDPSKNLDPAEAKALAAAGLDIVVVWETTAARALSGRTFGRMDAREALAQARACGIPNGQAIYFAVDFDETAGQAAQVAAYFKGVHDVLDHVGAADMPRSYPVGAYGGFWTIKRLFDAKLIDYGWQTYAWSGGHWDTRAQLQQYSNGHTLGGVSCDYNRATADDFGQWRPT